MPLPRVRFSIRVMMLAVLAVGLLLGWRVNKARMQGEAVAAVRGLGGDIVFDHDLNTRGRYVPNPRTPWGPRWLREALGPEYFRTVSSVWVRRKGPDPELRFLRGLTDLRTLHIHGADISDSGLSCLRSMPHLRSLDLMNCPLVGDAAAQDIAGLSGLHELYLNGTRFTDAGLTCVRGKPMLRVLFLNDLRVTDAGLSHLEGATNLESLALGGTHVTDAGLGRVGRLTKLWQLGLQGTQVTDAGLVSLKGLTGLKILVLDQTRVTESGVAELRKALPGAEISWGH